MFSAADEAALEMSLDALWAEVEREAMGPLVRVLVLLVVGGWDAVDGFRLRAMLTVVAWTLEFG